MPEGISAEFLALQRAVLGRYSLERELGRGGMGIVFLAREISLDRFVALKVLPPHLASQPAFRQRFVREARTAAKLSHPNIVPIFTVEEVGDWVFYAMAFVEGETLGDRVRREGPLRPVEAVRVLREVAWALGYSHQRGVVHRDIKPENILLESGNGRALVTDFGIAHVASGTGITQAGQVLGTPEFMSPEQASGEPPDGRSDLYSLGVVGYFVLTGKTPFEGESPAAVLAKHLTQEVPPLRQAAPDVPGPLAAPVERCLRKEPGERFASGEALAEELGAALPQRRELPAVLARWVAAPEEVTLAQVAVAPMLCLVVFSLVEAVVDSGISDDSPRFNAAAAAVVGFSVPFLAFWIRRTDLLRRVIRNGHQLRDLRLALAHDWAAGPTITLGSTASARRIHGATPALGGLLLLVVLVLLPLLRGGHIDPDNLYEWSMFSYLTAFAIGSASELGYRVARPGKTLAGLLRRWFWGTRFARWWVRIAGLGIRRGDRTDTRHQATELALGSAARLLFEALPNPQRAKLRDMPQVIERLEREAGRVRLRLAELDELASGATSERLRRAGRASEQLNRRQSEVAAEIAGSRREAEVQFVKLMGALETLRLALLRLRAGSASVTSITAELEEAAELGRRISAEIEAQASVD